MKLLLAFTSFLCTVNCFAQQPQKTRNIFVITTDGFRWQEIFQGADSALLSNPAFVLDTTLSKQMFWDSSIALRRQKLMPFLWNVLSKQGQLYGNRSLDNKVNVKNFYKISYPGYNEIFSGYADIIPIFNKPVNNRNSNVLQYLNKQADFKGKVVAFSSWNIMPYILNEKHCGFSVNSGYELLSGHDELSGLIDTLQNTIPKNKTRNDQLTYLSAKNYVEQNHPKVMFLGLGETDEFAHEGRYDMYLQKAAAVDKMIADLWYFIQTDPFYKDNTTLVITTDHGRGNSYKTWRTHGFWAKGSGDVWLALIGPDIAPEGEMDNKQQIWQKQIASTVAFLVGANFTAKHPVANHIVIPSGNKAGNIFLAAANPKL